MKVQESSRASDRELQASTWAIEFHRFRDDPPSVEAVDDPLTAEHDEAIQIARQAIFQTLRGG